MVMLTSDQQTQTQQDREWQREKEKEKKKKKKEDFSSGFPAPIAVPPTTTTLTVTTCPTSMDVVPLRPKEILDQAMEQSMGERVSQGSSRRCGCDDVYDCERLM
jgi:hypothetical protein